MSDSIKRARSLALEAKNLELEIEELEARVSEKKAQRQAILAVKLPDLMNEIGLPSFEIAPQGNLAGFKVAVRPSYSATIPVSWPEPKKAKAFQALREHNAADLIKVEVVISFTKGQDDKAQQLIASLKEQGVKPSVRETVHPATLKSWLKERVESGQSTPELDLIGGRVATVAELKEIVETTSKGKA